MLCEELGVPRYRAAQLWSWLYLRRAASWSDMKNVPVQLRARLESLFCLEPVSVLRTEGSPGDTQKLLLGLRDGERIEEVLIPARDRQTVCVSSQVGCRFRCAFCASGQSGFRRNLETGEMTAQVLQAAGSFGSRPTHVVFMGIGEPFDNYDAVIKAARILNDAEGLAIGARRITISTCGIIPGIQRLAGEGLQFELSVSLHAPSDKLRSTLMPANRQYPLPALMDACRAYSGKTKRIITFEYALIKGVNDSDSCARDLARLLAPLLSRVNLIPLSPVEEFEGLPSPPETADLFIRTLKAAGINATLRASRGSSLKAACGQLRAAGGPP